MIDTKPQFYGVEKSQATYGTSSLTYNEAGLTYNEADTTYGGADIIQNAPPQLQTIIDIKPQL